ncbi:hypothetical protein, partial [Kineococcus endophyticus]
AEDAADSDPPRALHTGSVSEGSPGSCDFTVIPLAALMCHDVLCGQLFPRRQFVFQGILGQ